MERINNDTGVIAYPYGKNENGTCLAAYIVINFKWIKDLNTKYTIIKLLKET